MPFCNSDVIFYTAQWGYFYILHVEDEMVAARP